MKIRRHAILLALAALALGQSAEYKHAQHEIDTVTKRLTELDGRVAPLKQKVKEILAEVDRLQTLQTQASDVKTRKGLSDQIDGLLAEASRVVQAEAPIEKENKTLEASLEATLPLLKLKRDHADDCTALYSKTIDEKAADVTNREAEQIKACKAIAMYPPEK